MRKNTSKNSNSILAQSKNDKKNEKPSNQIQYNQNSSNIEHLYFDFQTVSRYLLSFLKKISNYSTLMNFNQETNKYISFMINSIDNYGISETDENSILTDFWGNWDNLSQIINNFYDNEMINQSLNFYNQQMLKIGNSMKIAEQSLGNKTQEVNNCFFNFYSELISLKQLIINAMQSYDIISLIEPFNQLYEQANTTFTDIFENSSTKRFKYCLMCMQRVQENLSEYQCWNENQSTIQKSFSNLESKIQSLIPNSKSDNNQQLFKKDEQIDQKQQILNDNQPKNKPKSKKRSDIQLNGNKKQLFQSQPPPKQSEENELFQNQAPKKQKPFQIQPIQNFSEENDQNRNKNSKNQKLFQNNLEENQNIQRKTVQNELEENEVFLNQSNSIDFDENQLLEELEGEEDDEEGNKKLSSDDFNDNQELQEEE